jgi:VWFA-related protein
MDLRTIVIVLALGGALTGAVPHDDPLALGHQHQPMFSGRSELVVLDVTVKEKNGAFVGTLPASAFAVTEDGRPQKIELFDERDAPATVGLLIDSSGSMQPSRDRVIAAAATFAETSNPQDEMFVLSFNDTVTAALPSGEAFTSSPDTLRAAMNRTISAIGRTALYDAVASGLSHVAEGSYARQVLVVVSDGGDNASAATFDSVLRQAQASNAVIYTVALADPLDTDANPRRLKQIADASGGEAFTPPDIAHVESALRQIAKDVRSSFALGYASTNEARDGKFRRIKVVARTSEGRTLVVRTRQGYVANPR